MDTLLAQLPARAREEKKRWKKRFRKVAQRPPKNLDYQVATLHEEVFEEIDCLSCANCCKTTSPIFRDIDIERIARHLNMRPANFVEQYLHLDQEGDYVLNIAPCPFLGSDNYCSIYEVRPKACREYPHTNRKKFHQIGSLTVKNTFICPAAYNIVEEMKKRLRA